jgi:hypothetical protein
MRSRIGQLVRIMRGAGPRKFIGKTGMIVGQERGDGRATLYRTEVGDEAVMWRGDCLKVLPTPAASMQFPRERLVVTCAVCPLASCAR